MTAEEVQGHIDRLKMAMMLSPWPHDPRTATRVPVIAVDWGSGKPETVYSAIQGGKMIYSTPEREEFCAWLAADGLKEER